MDLGSKGDTERKKYFSQMQQKKEYESIQRNVRPLSKKKKQVRDGNAGMNGGEPLPQEEEKRDSSSRKKKTCPTQKKKTDRNVGKEFP